MLYSCPTLNGRLQPILLGHFFDISMAVQTPAATSSLGRYRPENSCGSLTGVSRGLSITQPMACSRSSVTGSLSCSPFPCRCVLHNFDPTLGKKRRSLSCTCASLQAKHAKQLDGQQRATHPHTISTNACQPPCRALSTACAFSWFAALSSGRQLEV